jgi:hypothetical protein
MLDDLRAWVALAAAGAQFMLRTVAGVVALLSRDPQRRANARALLGALDGQSAGGAVNAPENPRDNDQRAGTNDPAEDGERRREERPASTGR